MTIKTEMLRCFCTVAQTGSLASAADRLGRTQAAISMTLKQLEDQLGSSLFEGKRKNRLSPLGEQVFILGNNQLRQLDNTFRTIQDLANSPQGLLRIASVPSVAALVYPSVVEFLSEENPGLHLELRDMDSQLVIDALVHRRADIGIASSHHVLNGVEVAPLFQDRFGLVCTIDHPLAKRRSGIKINDVLSAPFLRNGLCDQIETARFRSRLKKIHLLIHNTNSLLAMVRTGKWVTVLPKSIMGSAPENLCFLPIEDLPDERQVYLYLCEQGHISDIQRQTHAVIAEHQWSID
ncbi:MAG: LysR family transcriptional regulator [Paracoccaceae bacterium]